MADPRKVYDPQTCEPFDADEKYQLDKTQADTNSLHGDGLFPIRNRQGQLLPWNGEVIAASPANMTVKVKDFIALIKDIDGGAFTVGDRHLNNTVIKTLSVQPAHATLPRHDIVTISIPVDSKGRHVCGRDWSKVSIAIVKGTPAASPVDPTIPDNAIVLRRIVVRAGTTSILSTDLVDIREWLKDVDDLGNTVELPPNLLNRIEMLETKVTVLEDQPSGVVSPDTVSHYVKVSDVDEGASDYSLRPGDGAFQIGLQTTTPQSALIEDTFSLADGSPLDPTKWTADNGVSVLNGKARIEAAESFGREIAPYPYGPVPPQYQLDEWDLEYDLTPSADGAAGSWNYIMLGANWVTTYGHLLMIVQPSGFTFGGHYTWGNYPGSAQWSGSLVFDGVNTFHVKCSRRLVDGLYVYSMTVSGGNLSGPQTVQFVGTGPTAGLPVMQISFQNANYWGSVRQWEDIDNFVYRPVTAATYTYKATGTVKTEALPSASNIAQFMLNAEVDAPSGTAVAFDVSLDGGNNWVNGVALDSIIDAKGSPFLGLGDQALVRINMTGPGGTGDVTPGVKNVRIVTDGVLQFADFRNKYNGLIDVANAAADGDAFRTAVAALEKYSV
jgi:hypothetical protein